MGSSTILFTFVLRRDVNVILIKGLWPQACKVVLWVLLVSAIMCTGPKLSANYSLRV